MRRIGKEFGVRQCNSAGQDFDTAARFTSAVESDLRLVQQRFPGGDIDAACGQLRLKTERELAGVPVET
jgi:adenine C2-methylase RlmN of 23S rRNA A2503 and tRNA A37